MNVFCLHDKKEIETFLRKNVYLHLYSLGDLDDFFWSYTTWYATREKGEISAIVLVYTGSPLPVILAMRPNTENRVKENHVNQNLAMDNLIKNIIPFLPKQFYAHLSEKVDTLFKDTFQAKAHGLHYKMALTDISVLDKIDIENVIQLDETDIGAIKKLYDESYPDNWFDSRMLATKQYYGIKIDNRLVSIAGIHVYSKNYGIAALGNITTHPEFRKQGLGKKITAGLCKSLATHIDHIGLNVLADNKNAISMYEKTGFEITGTYNEFMMGSR